jgi:subtilase family serine protease
VTNNGTSRTFYANTQEISLPNAIRSRVASIAPINNLALDSYAAPVGPATWSRETHRATLIASPESTVNPDQTLTSNNQPFYALAPEDFATQYNLAPIYSGGTTGAGQTIGSIGTSNINLALVDAYRKLFNPQKAPRNPPPRKPASNPRQPSGN